MLRSSEQQPDNNDFEQKRTQETASEMEKQKHEQHLREFPWRNPENRVVFHSSALTEASVSRITKGGTTHVVIVDAGFNIKDTELLVRLCKGGVQRAPLGRLLTV